MSEMTNKAVKQDKPSKLPGSAHLMCGWPLALVFIGGLVGGGLGGAAYGINMSIYRSRLPVSTKIALNVLSGVLAFALWIAVSLFIQSTRS